MPDTSAYNPLTGINWDTRLSGTNISVYIYPGDQTVQAFRQTPDTTAEPNEYQLSRFAAAFQTFSNITKLTFYGVTRPQEGTLRLYLSPQAPLEDGRELLGFAFAPGGTGLSGLAGFNNAARGWSDAPGGTLEPGGNAFTTLIHELGHAIGLAHPHDNGGNSTIFPGVVNDQSGGDYDLNQGIYTMMSYRDGWLDGPTNVPAKSDLYGEESTPMAFDVAALQQKYGANTSFATGDDTYVLPDQNGTGTSYVCIWDAGGNNALRYDGPSDAVLDLRPATLKFAPGGGGYVSYVSGIRGGYTIANGVNIQTAVAGPGNDVLTANDAGCLLAAGAGQNTVVGGAGFDTVLSGGAGDLIAAGTGQGLVALNGTNAVVGAAGQDTVLAGGGTAMIGVWGSGSATVFGGAGALTFIGGAGSNVFIGSTGSATVFGGAGTNLLAAGAHGNNTLLSGTGAATLFGGNSGDMLFAQGTNQVLKAGAGDETLSGASATGGNIFYTDGGACTVYGGVGNDTVFAGSGNATVDAGAGSNLLAAVNGQAGGTMLINNFRQGADRLTLLGYAPNTPDTALANQTLTTQGVTLTLADNTRITFANLTTLTRASLV